VKNRAFYFDTVLQISNLRNLCKFIVGILASSSLDLAFISRILTASDALSAESDIRSLGSGIHQLKGEFKGFWSISVTANYRIIFTFKPPDVFDVDYLDYH
jgi:proteic killer suppression protein